MCIANPICDADEHDLEMQKLWYKFIFKVTSCIHIIPRASWTINSFSSWLSFNMVVRTGTKCSRSFGRHLRNCNMTFFIYSKFADSFSRSWFLSSLKNRIKSNEFIINDKENNYNEREERVRKVARLHSPSISRFVVVVWFEARKL